ncbi:MAG: hypothetical protein H3C35_11795, partial [Bacteroidetes bacterium]|nr:hypothetical protein [Bacteroidota bacterium]
MFKKRKIFFYSDETVSYVEANGYRVRFASKAVLFTIIGLILVGIINQMGGDLLGLAYLTDRNLMTE